MIFALLFYSILVLLTISHVTNHSERPVHGDIPFFVMKPHTIINQTLHSYCKEQFEFNTQPMSINLTEWPSGLIYGRNPYDDLHDDDIANEDDPIRYAPNEECTMELRTSIGTHIRLVFYSMVGQLRDDYDQDYPTKSACLRIRDNAQTRMYDCSSVTNEQPAEEYLSSGHVIHLEVLSSSYPHNDYDHYSPPQFKIFFTSLAPVVKHGFCPQKNLFDCQDSYCAHENARCNGIEECRSKLDEQACAKPKSNAQPRHDQASIALAVTLLFAYVTLLSSR